MDIYKEKFTGLQQEILRLLFIKSGESFNQRRIANMLRVSPTAIAKSIVFLEKENLIAIKRDKESKRLEISINKENPLVFELKRIENLRLIY